MNWFDRWFFKKVKHCWDHKDDYAETNAIRMPMSFGTISASRDVDSEDGLNMTVRNAMGGKIITFRHYDTRQDRHIHKLYVIPDDHDFEKELGKLITLEAMRQG